jgi:hypothetical protein
MSSLLSLSLTRGAPAKPSPVPSSSGSLLSAALGGALAAYKLEGRWSRLEDQTPSLGLQLMQGMGCICADHEADSQCTLTKQA